MNKSTFERRFQESEPTGANGSRMEWRLSVDEPQPGSLYAFIAIEESALLKDGAQSVLDKDVVVLDVTAAKWLYKTLGEAIEIAKDSERKAAMREAVNDK